MVTKNLDVKITGDHILDAYDTIKNDLDALFTDNPDRRVEFALGNMTDLHWRNLGTHNYAGGWVRSANPSEDLLPHHAIGAAVESHGGGAGAALAFYADLGADKFGIKFTVMMVVFGYCPKTASDRVEGLLLKIPTVMAQPIIATAHVSVKNFCQDLEDLGGDLKSWSGLVSLDDKTDLRVVANYSGGNDGIVEATISTIPKS